MKLLKTTGLPCLRDGGSRRTC